MMELKEALEVEGVESLEALKEKIRASEKVAADLVLAQKNTQITDLEQINTDNGTKLAEAGRTIASLTPENLPEKKPEDAQGADAVVKAAAEAQFKEKNEARRKHITEEDDAKLVKAYEGLAPEVRTLVDSSEEGLAGFTDEILGTTESPLQKTFRTPVEQVKLSITDQIKMGLGTLKPSTSPRMRPLGLVSSTATSTNESKEPAIAMKHDGGLLSAIHDN